ncbi:MAG: protein TolQ [Pseudomonadota bacterium]|nr:protein TolQ [Pseudomonadota bacterium]
MAPEVSILSLVLAASPLVKGVMGLLLLISIYSWYAILTKRAQLSKMRSQYKAFEQRFWSGIELGELYRQTSRERVREGMAALFVAGFGEFLRVRQLSSPGPEDQVEGAMRAMRAAQLRELERLETHLPTLATIGSTSPYIGLFGTVWGIMTSFQGLAGAQQATLSMVAPGIAEALIATAMGLFAAIPAVVAYNRFSAEMDRVDSGLDGFRDEFSNILQRHVGVTVDATPKSTVKQPVIR